MYRRIVLFMFSLLFTVMSMAQVMSAQEVSQDSTINIIAYFCKNDTLEYVHHDYEAQVNNNDTVVKHHLIEHFQLIVRDSTSNGYEIESIPLKTEVYFGKDTLMTNITQGLMEKLGDMSTIFTTDEYGSIQHIKNWKEIKNFSRTVIKAFCDSLYSACPHLDEMMPRARFEAQMSMQFTSEKTYIENSDDLQLLFSMYGRSIDIGKSESDDVDENGYPQHTIIIGGYGKVDQEYGFDDDFFLQAEIKTTIPKEDVKEHVKNTINMVVGDKYAGNINEDFDKMEYQDATVTSIEDYNYFYNGWPCEMEHTKITDMMGIKTIEINKATWTYRAWGVFTGAAETESVNL